MPDWDDAFEFPSLPDLFFQWQTPQVADQTYAMEQELFKVKDVMLDSLSKVLQRGEQLENLQKKTDSLKVQTI